MNNKERLEKLKQLQITEKNESALYSHKEFLAWIDNVAPLLKYDTQHYNNFIKSARTASTRGLSSRSITYYLNIAKSVVNQAIIELENDITEAKPTQQTINKKEINKSSDWHNKPIGKIIIGVIIGAIVIIIGLIINHFFINPSQEVQLNSSPESKIYQAGRDIIVNEPSRNKASATDIIESIVIESRLTSVLKENTKYPPVVYHFIPISGAPATFEGPAGTVKLVFQSPINFKRLDNDEIIIINKFNMLSGSDLNGRSVSVLHNYESLVVPIVTAMFGNSFSTLRLLEVTIYLNGDAKWYKSWVYNVDFPRGNSFNIPLSDILAQ